MTEYDGIVDKSRNPFAIPSWIDQGYGLTTNKGNRAAKLEKLFGKTIDEIKDIKTNDGRYPAFVGIRWGFAEIKNNRLVKTEKWNNRIDYDEYGESLNLTKDKDKEKSKIQPNKKTDDLFTTPTAHEYAKAFHQIKNITDSQIQMLRIHYFMPKHIITANQLALAMGYSSYPAVNSQYGKLASLIGDILDYSPEPEKLGTLVIFEKKHGEWHWIMRPEVAKSMEILGWVEDSYFLLPEETSATASLVEGAVCKVSVNAYERNNEARIKCLEHHGYTCCICNFNFKSIYGSVGDNFIHVHHIRPLSEIGQEYIVDPVKDLRPVCPNCHAVIHRRIPAYTIEEVCSFLNNIESA